jgi:hypothetical protein
MVYEELIYDERKNRFQLIREYEVGISLFRVRDVVIVRESVRRIGIQAGRVLITENSTVEWIALDRNNAYNIYPTNLVRADGRIEIPRRINRLFRLAEQVLAGRRTIKVYVKYNIRPESRELVAYINYEELFGKAPESDYAEYKLWRWVPINFPYKSGDELAGELAERYKEETIDLWFKVFCFFMQHENFEGISRNDVKFGLTNRVKFELFIKGEFNANDFIWRFENEDRFREYYLPRMPKTREEQLSFFDELATWYDILKATITYTAEAAARHGREVYAELNLNRLFLKEFTPTPPKNCGWKKIHASLYDYRECYYEIFLDIDQYVLDKYKFYAIDEYLKYLINVLKENNIRYEKIEVYLSSSRLILPRFNYHIIVRTYLTKEEWRKIDKILIEDERRKFYHEVQGASILRVSDKRGFKPKLILELR